MMTQKELLAFQAGINEVFKTHWDRIDKLEFQVAILLDEVKELKAAKVKKVPAAKKATVTAGEPSTKAA